MKDYFKHDERIEEGSSLRDLEKKLHWVMYQLAQAGIALDASNCELSFPDDLNAIDIQDDAMEVTRNARDNGIVSGAGNLGG